MAKTKARTNPYPAIARPILKGELDANRVHFIELSRVELEDLLIRAANELELLRKGYQFALDELKARTASMRRGPEARLANDKQQVIKKRCQEEFDRRTAERPIRRGDRAQFIRDMGLVDEDQVIGDPNTFGEWWDQWKKALKKGQVHRSQPPAEVLAYWAERDRIYDSMPKILRTLGYVPKGLPRHPYSPD